MKWKNANDVRWRFDNDQCLLSFVDGFKSSGDLIKRRSFRRSLSPALFHQSQDAWMHSISFLSRKFRSVERCTRVLDFLHDHYVRQDLSPQIPVLHKVRYSVECYCRVIMITWYLESVIVNVAIAWLYFNYFHSFHSLSKSSNVTVFCVELNCVLFLCLWWCLFFEYTFNLCKYQCSYPICLLHW